MKKLLILLPAFIIFNMMPAFAQDVHTGDALIKGLNLQVLGVRLVINIIAIYILVRLIYFTRHKNKDFQFTLILFNSVNFMICFLLSGANLEVGFAFGLFAIFSIMRYRTVTVPVKEMGYLFVSVAMGLINSLATVQDHYVVLIIANAFIILLPLLLDRDRTITTTKIKGNKKNKDKNISGLMEVDDMATQDITYERIDLIKPERRNEMIDDLRDRTGLPVNKVDIISIDLMHDVALIKAYYQNNGNENLIRVGVNHNHI